MSNYELLKMDSAHRIIQETF